MRLSTDPGWVAWARTPVTDTPVCVHQMGLFISYDNATKQLDTVYDLTPELARAFLERIGASDFDLRNTSTVHRQAGLSPGSGAPGHCPGQPPLSSPQREGRRPAPLFDQSPVSVPERGGVSSKRTPFKRFRSGRREHTHSRGPLCARIPALNAGMGLQTLPFQGKRRIPIMLGRVLE